MLRIPVLSLAVDFQLKLHLHYKTKRSLDSDVCSLAHNITYDIFLAVSGREILPMRKPKFLPVKGKTIPFGTLLVGLEENIWLKQMPFWIEASSIAI